MATSNPFASDAVLGEAWEQGFLAGFRQPEADHLPPFAPKILDAYLLGERAGRDERRLLPPDEGGLKTEPSGLAEVAEELGLHALGHAALERLFGAAGGLAALLITVLQIPGDTQLQPLEPDWTGPADQPDDAYVAVCPRNDHGPIEGSTSEGYWTGPGRQVYSDALTDIQQHSHAEACVARCAVPDGECGLVWPGTGQ